MNVLEYNGYLKSPALFSPMESSTQSNFQLSALDDKEEDDVVEVIHFDIDGSNWTI
jgi:hypothetical protein